MKTQLILFSTALALYSCAASSDRPSDTSNKISDTSNQISNDSTSVTTESKPEAPELLTPEFVMEKDGLAVTEFAWKQRDSSLHIDYTITYKNVGVWDIDGAQIAYEFIYADGDSSGQYSFSFPIGPYYDKKELKNGESFTRTSHESIPRSFRMKEIIKDVKLEILDVD